MSTRVYVLVEEEGIYFYDDAGNETRPVHGFFPDMIAPDPKNIDEAYYAFVSENAISRSANSDLVQPSGTIKDLAVSEDFLYVLHGTEVTQYSHTNFPAANWTNDFSGTIERTLAEPTAISAFDGGVYAVGHDGAGESVVEIDESGAGVNSFIVNLNPNANNPPNINCNLTGDWVLVWGQDAELYNSSGTLQWQNMAMWGGAVRTDATGIIKGTTVFEGPRSFDIGGIKNDALSEGVSSGYYAVSGTLSFAASEYYTDSFGDADEPAKLIATDLSHNISWNKTLSNDPLDIAVWDYSGDGPEPTTYSITGQVTEAGEVEADGYQDASDTVAVDVGTTSYTLNIAIEAEETEGDPPIVAGMVGRYDASQINASQGASLSSWADTSGNSNDITVSGNATTPTFDTDAFPGGPGVFFNGSGDALILSVAEDFDLDDFTIFTVFKASSSDLTDEIGTIYNKQGSSSHSDRNFWYVLDRDHGFAGGGGALALRTSSAGDTVTLNDNTQNYVDDTPRVTSLRVSATIDNEAELRISGQSTALETNPGIPDGKGHLLL